MLCLTSPTMNRWQPPSVSARKIISCRALVSWYSSSMISAYRPPSSLAKGVGVPSGCTSSVRASCSRSPKSSFLRSSLAAAYRLSNSRMSARSRSISGASFSWSSRYCRSSIRNTFVFSSLTASDARRRSFNIVSLASVSVHFFRGKVGKLASSTFAAAVSQSSPVTLSKRRVTIPLSSARKGSSVSRTTASSLRSAHRAASPSRSAA